MATFQSGTSNKKVSDSRNQKQLVNFSVRAQDFILKQGQPGHKKLNNTEDFSGIGSTIGGVGAGGSVATTDATFHNNESTMMKSKFGAVDPLGPLQLPKINAGNQSPFKGFIDISIVSQKMRKSLGTTGRMQGIRGHNSVKGNLKDVAQAQKDNFFNEDYQAADIINAKGKKRGSSQNGGRGPKMSSEVLKTWINETLQDAEHLDIPGVVLNAQHKNPIQRYNIDSLNLQEAGIPPEDIDRIYRALFVYSVGFHELIKKCLEHTKKKYTIITQIWKVFAILLEYCCRTDYRMLISEISKESEDKIREKEELYQQKFQEQANQEKNLKQQMETLQKGIESLEKKWQQEKQMRLKLEEEYMQNTKNHEEEVQLRLKFESKLNNMHSAHRDLETKFKRTRQDLQKALSEKQSFQDQVSVKIDEITELKSKNTEQFSKITNQKERIDGLIRDLQIKSDQLVEFEKRNSKTLDELDLVKYKLQEQQKDMTEMKLKTDVLTSTNDGLASEKEHLTVELKETRELQKSYEKKCGELIIQLNEVQKEYQDIRKKMIGHDELAKEREERIEKLKTELEIIKAKFEKLDIEHGTLMITHAKVEGQYNEAASDLKDTTEKLHITNKVRHETEIKLGEEIEAKKGLQEVVKIKEETLNKRASEIEELDKKVIDLERQNEQTEIKKQGIERAAELTKKQLTEKITSLNEIINGEKETREMWIERFEKEQSDHTQTNAILLQSKSDLKDQILATKNAEIKLQTVERQVEILSSQNKKFQTQINETSAKQENLERELNTQKEIMKQFEITKKEYIQKLKDELENVEERFKKIINQNLMTGEDFRSQAVQNFHKFVNMKLQFKEKTEMLEQSEKELEKAQQDINDLDKYIQDNQMENEDYLSQIVYKTEKIQGHEDTIEDQHKRIEMLTELKESQAVQLEELQNKNTELLNQLTEEQKCSEQLRQDIIKLEDEFNDFKMESEDKQQELKTQITAAKKNLEEREKELLEEIEELESKHANEKREQQSKLDAQQEQLNKVPSKKSIKSEKKSVVPMEPKETQTDIDMKNWDQMLRKSESKASAAQSNGSKRVGGGGAIAKPPRAGSRSSANKPQEANMNVTGMSQQSQGSGRNGSGKQLPNLLKQNSQVASQKSMLQKPVDGSGKDLQNTERMNRNVDDMKNQQTLQSSNMPNGTIEEPNSTALGTLAQDPGNNMQTLPVQSINNEGNDTISATGQMKAGQETIDPNTHQTIQNQVIQEEEMEGENVVAPLQENYRQSPVQNMNNQQNTVIASKQTLSKQSSRLNDQGKSENLESHRSQMIGSQQSQHPRMKVNINNQEMGNYNEADNSYMSALQQPQIPQNQHQDPQIITVNPSGGHTPNPMQPQMVQMNRQLMQPQQPPQQTLQQSIVQNNRRVTGASSIRTLIKSAATRN